MIYIVKCKVRPDGYIWIYSYKKTTLKLKGGK
jgi:hypothetical protein